METKAPTPSLPKAGTVQSSQAQQIKPSGSSKSPNSGSSASSNLSSSSSSRGMGFKPLHTAATTPSFGVPSTAQRADTPVEAERPNKRMKLDFLHPLEIIVGGGEQPQTFHVPRNLITSRSTFIKDIKPDNGRPVTLPDEEPTAFSVYLQCIHDNSVVVDDDEAPAEDAWKLLAQTYVLANKLKDSKTVDLIMDEIIRRLRNPFTNMQLGAAIKFAFDNTPVDSKLRKVFVDYAVRRNMDRELIKELAGIGATEFLVAVTEGFMDYRDKGGFAGFGRPSLGPNSFAENAAQYHIKSDDPKKEG